MDLFALCLGTKNGFVKICKAHKQRLRLNLHDFRVIRADAAEGDTYINVGGFLAEWTTGKKNCGLSITTAFVMVISRCRIVF